jgi:twitching motility protein PilT
VDLKAILARADELEASTVHLASGRVPVLRLLDRLLRLDVPPLQETDFDAFARGVLTASQLADYDREGDVSFLYRDGDACYKATLFRVIEGQGLVLKRLSRIQPTFEDLGLPVHLEDYIRMRSGLVLLTGPIGCGKTTTLNALLQRANRERDLHVLSIEDPIESVLDDGTCFIQQCEVGQQVATTLAGVELARRVHPDLLLISDLADRESVDAVIDATDGGMLVIAAMHASSVTQALAKLEEFFPLRQRDSFRRRLCAVIKVVACQVLVHKQYGTGILPVFEVLTNTPDVRNMLRSGAYAKLRGVMERSRGLGMCTLDDALYDMVKRNQVLVDEAMVYAVDKERFEACRRVPQVI